MEASLNLSGKLLKRLFPALCVGVSYASPLFALASLSQDAKLKKGVTDNATTNGEVLGTVGLIIYYIEIGTMVMGLMAIITGGYMLTTSKGEGAKWAFIGGIIMLMASAIVKAFVGTIS